MIITTTTTRHTLDAKDGGADIVEATLLSMEMRGTYVLNVQSAITWNAGHLRWCAVAEFLKRLLGGMSVVTTVKSI